MKPARAPVATERPLMQIAVHVRVTDSPDKLVKLPAQDYAVAMGMHDELGAIVKCCDRGLTEIRRRPSRLSSWFRRR
jgi:hypothetical protein